MTQFRNHLCWQAERMATVMADGVAERIRDADRAATHFAMPMHSVELRHALGGRGWSHVPGEPTTAEKVLEGFRDHPSKSVAAAILGDAGTGKTHLLKWIQAHLPQRDDTKVIVIPRKNVGLPGVVALLIEGLKGSRFDSLRHDLASAGAHMTHELARELVATNLAAYVRHGTDPVGETTDEMGIVSDYLRVSLPNLLLDRAFINYVTGPGGPFASMGEHLTHWSGGPTTESPLAFDAALLCRPVRNLQRSAEEVAAALRDEPTFANLAAALCNHELRRAVQGQVAQGVMSNIGQLLEDVRVEYGRQGKKITLLFEDLARAQFIDEELVLACVGDQRPDGPQLAPMRTLFACTTGMFRQLRETVVQRIRGPIVTLDDPDNAQDRIVIRAAAARYLNAVRTPTEAVDDWFTTPVDRRQPLPSACSGCPHVEPCHAAFGSHEGVGLYPFTETALANLTRGRVGGAFVARIFVTKVLYETVDDAGKAIPAGKHPTPACVRALDPAGISVTKKAPQEFPDDPDRWVRATQLYGAPNLVTRDQALPPGVAEAFGLGGGLAHSPAPRGDGRPAVVKTHPPAPPVTPPSPDRPKGRDAMEMRLMAWASEQGIVDGTKLLQTDVTNMRKDLRRLVLDNFELSMWTGWPENLAESLFPAKSINFRRMDLASDAEHVNVPVVLPASDSVKGCREVVFLWSASDRMQQGIESQDPADVWQGITGDEYVNVAQFIDEVGGRLMQVAETALGGRRLAARLAVAGAVWARLDIGSAVTGSDAWALAASLLAQDTPGHEREALLATTCFLKGDGHSYFVDAALLQDAATKVLSVPLTGLQNLPCPREPSNSSMLANLLGRARHSIDAAPRARAAVQDDLQSSLESIEAHTGNLPNKEQRRRLVEACEELLKVVERVAPVAQQDAHVLRAAIRSFATCGIEEAARAVRVAREAQSDIAALLSLRDPVLLHRVTEARKCLELMAALVVHAENREQALSKQESARYGGKTLQQARQETLDELCTLGQTMAAIEDGGPNAA